ncbi:MAG: hypothetical protein FWH20_08935 [Oscillospiraceae bacterium]|nr:hypothetical protein [Oscillospiraceae bacterium]
MKKITNHIYITGDTHGDLTRFKKAKFLRKGDFLIICGDFGFIWDGSKKEKRLLKKLGKQRFYTLFVDGIHENFEVLKSYPEDDWCGGRTRHISGNLRHLMRGEIFKLGDKTVLAFGGGRLDEVEADADFERSAKAEKGSENFPEIAKEAEYRRGLQSIARHGNKVDYIVSHEAPSKIAEFLELPNSDKSRANAYLDILGENCAFERWFFGSHHINKVVPSKYFALFDKIMRADEQLTMDNG